MLEVLFMISIPQWSDFNHFVLFHFQQILPISIPQWSDFNKKFKLKKLFNNSTFQSHNGLILIDFCNSLCTPYFIFISIPQWSDFNFPSTGIVSQMSKLISIPQWSDFNLIGSLTLALNLKFQSHNGLILIHRIDLPRGNLYEFQSHNGLILMIYQNCQILTFQIFQSHNGLILINLHMLASLVPPYFNPTMV